ncbi:MAG: FtsW/RodA/SpoVE family cell cycle protein [Flavobacteriaceae bacterium]|nr:FtsW/RodA/SpoVE family cell cycle protein [Flavobacteriaceae bacterium]
MRSVFRHFKGDKVLWGVVALLAIFSFLPVFSASSNLSYVVGVGTPTGYLIKHCIILIFGFFLMFLVHKIPYSYFKGISILSLPLVFLLLIYTASQGTVIAGANASRWIRIPVIGLSFQTSTLAFVSLLIYVAYYLAKNEGQPQPFGRAFLLLWLPIFSFVFLILPSNFSTAALLFAMAFVLAFVGRHPAKYLMGIVLSGVAGFLLFILLVKAFPDSIPNRVDTWMNRVENFNSEDNVAGNYQIERAKIAVASGGLLGVGAGKSVMKNFLPQSSSDFIYAIIIEEYGLIGGCMLLLLYLVLLFRIVVVAYKTTDSFGKLLAVGMGLPIVFQALINMGVALQVLPVTGQTLPLISSGGTSAWMTCIAFGILLSVSVNLQVSETPSDNPLAELSEIE